MANILQELKGKPEQQLIQELAHMIKSGKGGLSPYKAKQMIQTIIPMVDSEQRSKLEKLAKELGR